MTWHISESLRCLLEPGAASLAGSCLDGEQFAPSKSSPTAAKSSCGGKTKATSTRSPYGTTCERLTELSGAAKWMSSLEDSPARTSALQARATGSTVNEAASGEKWPVSLAKYDPVSRSWKIARHLFGEDLTRSSETWPRWGMTVGGELYPLPMLVRHTVAPAYGCWPTPVKTDGFAVGWCKTSIERKERGETRPSGAHIGSGLKYFRKTGLYLSNGYPNPLLTEWLMGWPTMWTALLPLATDKFQQWQQQHGAFLEASE